MSVRDPGCLLDRFTLRCAVVIRDCGDTLNVCALRRVDLARLDCPTDLLQESAVRSPR